MCGSNVSVFLFFHPMLLQSTKVSYLPAYRVLKYTPVIYFRKIYQQRTWWLIAGLSMGERWQFYYNVININVTLLDLIYFTFKIVTRWRIDNDENKPACQFSDKPRPSRIFCFHTSFLNYLLLLLLAFAVLFLRKVVIRINDGWTTKRVLDIKLIFSYVIYNIN